MRLALLLASALSLPGCGVDATRTMWEHSWVEPGRTGFVHRAGYCGEVTGKAMLTPATAAVDVVTDPLTWECILVVAQATLESCAVCCR